MSAQLHVLLAQLPVPSSPSLNTPLAAGYLKAYAERAGPLANVTIDILPRAIADHAGDAALVEAIVARAPDLLGLSLYTWNSERSLDVALGAKRRLPGLRVLVGGPEVQPDNAWLFAHPAVDLAVIGEGEQTFGELLAALTGTGEQGNRGTGEQGNRGTEEQGNRGTGEQGNRGTGEQGNRGTGEQGNRGTGEQRNRGTGEQAGQPDSRTAGQPDSPTAGQPDGPTAEQPNGDAWLSSYPIPLLPGLAVRARGGGMLFGPERVALGDLAVVPSPYLGGQLELPPDGMLMVEVSRWCPYSCGFCLYGRNMGPKLGSRYFGLERVLAEIAWGMARGVRRVHFVEANLNLVPLFWPLMRALADLNAERQLTFYAELRGEHLSDAVVAALDAANVRVVEVGLQTANPAALRAAYRRTDLQKWAAGTRRLYARDIEVYLDVILGLPADDPAGVAETLAFLDREQLGPYDIFTLQLLPGTAARREAERYGMTHQDRPPYYVLGTDRMGYAELRRLRRQLKQGAGLDPDAVEAMPAPRAGALSAPDQHRPTSADARADLIERLDLRPASLRPHPATLTLRIAAHLDILLSAADLIAATPLIAACIQANPSSVIDLYLISDDAPPTAQALHAWQGGLPFQPGYLDRVAVYAAETPEPAYRRVSPRVWLVLPWSAQTDPEEYVGAAAIIWRFALPPGEALPLGAWRAAGGAGIWLGLDPATPPVAAAALRATAHAWAADQGRLIWHS